MGCASSKPPVCRNCRKPCSPINRSHSMHVHHPPQRQGDTYHVVALTSSTLGSLKLDPLNQSTRSTMSSAGNSNQNNQTGKGNKDFLFELVEAKTWSKMIDQKIPKIAPRTPVTTPPGEPETINAWELMEGLEDGSPLQQIHNRSFSFQVGTNFNQDKIDPSKSKTHPISNEILVDKDIHWRRSEGTPKRSRPDTTEPDPNPVPNSNSPSIVSDFDADVIKTFRKTLEELPPANPFHLNPSDEKKSSVNITNDFDVDNNPPLEFKKSSRKQDKVIVYFTSLRGVRKTYEDCCNVLVMLKGIGIKVDERDVSMHSGFKDELKELLKDGFKAGGLPKVFIGKQHIGGIDEIRRLNEDGKLGMALDGCERVNDGNGEVSVTACEGCGDVRFVPCEECSGSCKIYYESDDDEHGKRQKEEERYGFERCTNCNENGLIRCPVCCD